MDVAYCVILKVITKTCILYLSANWPVEFEIDFIGYLFKFICCCKSLCFVTLDYSVLFYFIYLKDYG